MSDERKLLEIKAAIYEVSLLFNQQASDVRIEAYAKALINYTPRQIIYAFRQQIKLGSAFFPSMSEILVHLQEPKEPKEVIAPRVVNEIVDFIRMHSPHLEANYYKDLSPVALATIQLNGGTKAIRDSSDGETMRAQLRNLVISTISRVESREKSVALNKIGLIQDGKLLEFDKLKRISSEDFSL